MSKKINIAEIVTGHFRTLTNESGKTCAWDMLTFVAIPLLLAILSAFFSFVLSDQMLGLLVNFGSIFTALLLSVLVLVYDQETKLDDRPKNSDQYRLKKELLRQLYYNISYSIICAVALVLFCFLHSAMKEVGAEIAAFDQTFSFRLNAHLVTPIVIFFSTNVVMNILMIVKRMHALLVTR